MSSYVQILPSSLCQYAMIIEDLLLLPNFTPSSDSKISTYFADLHVLQTNKLRSSMEGYKVL